MNERVERMFGARESWGKGKTPSGPRATSPKGEGEGVKGFVSIRCGGCGKVINTCLHEERTIFNCKACGHPNPLESMKSMKVECPRCSFRGLYKTNREESPIVMECLNCSHPVPLRKGKRRGNYVTIRERGGERADGVDPLCTVPPRVGTVRAGRVSGGGWMAAPGDGAQVPEVRTDEGLRL